MPIGEAHPRAPINPYGRSKWMVEQMLQDFDRAYGLRSVCLGYFNTAGADPEGKLGARREGDPPTLVADSKRARSELGWTPRFHALETIIEHAWAWERKVAGGATPFSGSRTAR